MKVAIAGATGLVGGVMLEEIQRLALPVAQLILVASPRSAGKEVSFKGKAHKVVGMETALEMQPDVALFSMGAARSKAYAPQFAQRGAVVIDNSSAWRTDPTKKLIIPEINGDALRSSDRIIANPNCSTIQMLMVLAPLHRRYGIRRVVISTYQSVSGSGNAALTQLRSEQAGESSSAAYPHPIHNNLLPHCGDFLPNGYTQEEMKLTQETVKILTDASVKVTATAVRVPVEGAHSESLNVELSQDFEMDALCELLHTSPGVQVVDDPAQHRYPMPQTAAGSPQVFVGRLRKDFSQPNTLHLWVVADNLRKGAATNAVQIAKLLIDKNLLKR